MANDKIMLWAEAKRLKIDGYRKMPEAELRQVIARAKTGASAPAKGKAATANGTKGKAAATTAVKGKPAKGKVSTAKGKGKTAVGKATQKSAPAAKSTAQKTTAKGRTAAQGKATRPTGAKGKATTKGATVTRGKATTKPKATAKTRTASRSKDVQGYRVSIDNKKVNWRAESTVGTEGKRKQVLDSLRKNKGDKAKVFAELKRYSTKWYAGKDKHEADRTLVWLIGRVALDFVKNTGQHTSGERAAYGTSTVPNDVRRREARAAASKPARKASTARKTAAPARGKGKPASPARKPAQKRTAAPKGKGRTAPAKGKGRR